MARINENFQKLPGSYLFSEVGKRRRAFIDAHPDADVISLGIGDVTLPLTSSAIEALHRGTDEMSRPETFRGYGPEQGYTFLREAIAKADFGERGVRIDPDEIFIGDGAKSDTGNIGDIFDLDNKVAVCDPVYPVYVDTNAMAGRAGNYDPSTGRWDGLIYIPGTAENGFVPGIRDIPVGSTPDIIYLCFPNNPTGTVAGKEELKEWVDYAISNRAVILFDAAYEAYITDPLIPHSIFEIPGADECAIEFRSFSKTAGFTGVRCGYTVVPKGLVAWKADGSSAELRPFWTRRQTTKFNGCSYITQRGAEAVYSSEGAAQTKATIDFYLGNAKVVKDALLALGYDVTGGTDSPYLWVNVKGDSWSFFDRLLKEANVVTTPGAGFGRAGEGYIRISAFNSRANVEEAVGRIAKVLG